MNITINSHSSIRAAGSKVLYFDPFQMREAPHDGDILFITHDHYDHFSPEDITKAAKEDTTFVVPHTLAGKLPEDKTVILQPGEIVEIQGIRIEAIAAYNIEKKFHPKENGWLGYRVTMDGETLYVCGDTDATAEAGAVSCDILALPVGGTYTMNAAQAAELAKAIRPKLALPTHYGSIVGSKSDAMQFRQLVGDTIQVELLVEDAK
mgnify:CR=1 FL=1